MEELNSILLNIKRLENRILIIKWKIDSIKKINSFESKEQIKPLLEEKSKIKEELNFYYRILFELKNKDQ